MGWSGPGDFIPLLYNNQLINIDIWYLKFDKGSRPKTEILYQLHKTGGGHPKQNCCTFEFVLVIRRLRSLRSLSARAVLQLARANKAFLVLHRLVCCFACTLPFRSVVVDILSTARQTRSVFQVTRLHSSNCILAHLSRKFRPLTESSYAQTN